MLRLASCALLALCMSAPAQVEPRILFADLQHLGDSRIESWPAGTPEPVGRELVVEFESAPNREEQCLLLAHHDVDHAWTISINGAAVGELARGKTLRDHLYTIPRGALRGGRNVLRVAPPPDSNDDILVGRVRLFAETLREHLDLRPLAVTVRDDRGRAIPARITITDPAGELVEVYYAATARTAVRKGVVYAVDGEARLELPRGEAVVWAGRGMEWGVDSRRIAVGDQDRVELSIRREVDTTGYVACDSHVHTYTFSGHGDSTLEERLITLAGEGVELAIATDHNHHTDYRPKQKEMRLGGHYTSVTGNEVTTKNGHFNAFPLDPKTTPPNWKLDDWVRLIEGIRAKGAKVVVLNHPRWPQIHTGPFGKQHFHLNRLSGAFADGPAITFDAIELVNSTVDARDPLYTFVDWFALLNHGETIRAVGTSDSHTVGDPVGQGRTYLRSSTDDPARIDVDEACDAFKNGASSIAQGIFTEVWVAESVRMGGLAKVRGDSLPVSLRVASASWVRPERALVYLNGMLVAERDVPIEAGRPTDVRLDFELAAPANDAHLVCIVLGPGVRARHWRADSTNDYTLGATNPVFVDADGDGAYASPRELATEIVRCAGARTDRLVALLEPVDDAVAIQALAIVHEQRGDGGGDHDSVLAEVAAGLGRPLVQEFARSLEH